MWVKTYKEVYIQRTSLYAQSGTAFQRRFWEGHPQQKTAKGYDQEA